jgi:uncharacterized protein (TIGR03089 family)
MSLTERLLGPILTADAARPLITYYDDADGSRIELSGATVANWAAKCANWLRDDCDLEPGDPVHVDLPAHWQTVGALLGAWWCGADVVDSPSGAAVSLVAPDRVTDGAAQVNAVVSLHPMGLGLRTTPPGHLDYVSEIRVHGDFFHPLGPVPGDTLALIGATVDQVAADAAAVGIPRNARVLSTRDWTLPDGLTNTLLAVLAANASLVHCANPDPTTLDARATAEHVTLILDAHSRTS